MDKDNKDDFTFARLSDLTLPVTFRMWEPLIHDWRYIFKEILDHN